MPLLCNTQAPYFSRQELLYQTTQFKYFKTPKLKKSKAAMAGAIVC